MTSTQLTRRAVQRVIAALGPEPSFTPAADHTVLAAEVLAAWFGASLQLVTTGDRTTSAQLDQLSGTIGLRTDPVLVLPAAGFNRALDDHASKLAPSLVVAAATSASLAAAASATQPTYLLAPGPRRRQPSGPLVVAPAGNDDVDDALALATIWAQALECPITLLATGDPEVRARAEATRARLESMGLQATVAIDDDWPGSTDEHTAPPSGAVGGPGSTPTPMALVVAADELTDPDRAARFLAAGGNLLVAPAPAVLADRQPAADLESIQDLSAVMGESGEDRGALTAEECQAVLEAAVIGRIGYVDHGWPVVVPVNFTVHQGDIVIRSVRGGKLEAARADQRVCFEADTISAGDRRGASVVVHGHLEVIGDAATLQAAWANDPQPWIDDELMVWLRLVSLATTGRRVG